MMRTTMRVALLALAGVVTTVTAMRWSNVWFRQGLPEGQKIEALTDAVNNGLISPQEYEVKVTELVGGYEKGSGSRTVESPSGWTAADTGKIAALGDALASGALSKKEFDEQVAEFARSRQKRVRH
ncbi:MAG: hypothetical protein WCE52_03930 [Candidatus Acidiferrum sp.]